MDATIMSLQVGSNLYEYKTDEVIGKGMYGVVNPARLIRNGKEIIENLCIKRIKSDEFDKKQQATLARENEVLEKISNLGNSNIVTTYEITNQNNCLYIIMERCNGGDLQELMTQRKNMFTPEEVIEIIGSIVNGYKGLQIYSIVHRDLKPANILIDKQIVEGETVFVYKLTDFGMSRVIDEAQKQQSVKLTRVGTPYYTSPQIQLDFPYREGSDVFSLGVIAHTLLHQGEFPFQTRTPQGIRNWMLALQKQPHTCEKCYSGATAPQELIELIESMLRFNEADRPSWKDLEKHPLIRPYITQQDRKTDYQPMNKITTYNKQSKVKLLQPQQSFDRGRENIRITIQNNTLQDSMFISDCLPVGQKLSKSQRLEKFIKILLSKGDQAYELTTLLSKLFTIYPHLYDAEYNLLFLILTSYKYNTLLSCYGLITLLPSYVTPDITSIVKWDQLEVGLKELQQNAYLYNQYYQSIFAQIHYYYGLQSDFTRDFLQRTRGVTQATWVYQMLNHITNDYAPYLIAIQYLHQTKIRQKLNNLQSLIIPYPNEYLVLKIYYYLEMLMRIESTYPFSKYQEINEQTIGDIPPDNELAGALGIIYLKPVV